MVLRYGGKNEESSKGKAGKNVAAGYLYTYETAKGGNGVMAFYQIGVVNPTTWIKLYFGGYLSMKKKSRFVEDGLIP